MVGIAGVDGSPGDGVTVARYLRVSTDKQSTENQEPDIARMVAAREPAETAAGCVTGFDYRETGSAAKDRPVFDRMMEDARLGKFRKLYVWSLDRFGRSMFQNLRDLRLLVETYRVTVISVREPWVEATSDRMTRELLLSVLGWVAEFERERLIQRTRAGLDRARAKGTKLGRRRVEIPEKAVAKAVELRTASRGRVGWREIARELERVGLGRWSHATLSRACTKRVAEKDRGAPGWRGAAGSCCSTPTPSPSPTGWKRWSPPSGAIPKCAPSPRAR